MLGTVSALLLTLVAVGSPAAATVTGHTLAAAPSVSASSTSDFLFVGDAGDDSVKQFKAATGQYLGAFVAPGSGGLNGPRGMLVEGNLLVSNQNVSQPYPGEIDQYSHVNGKFLGALVPHTGGNAPGDPDGIIRAPDNRTLYVSDLGDFNCDLLSSPCNGRVAKYDVKTGRFLGNLDFSSFTKTTGEFHPRGLVFGPDGRLYVSVRSLTAPTLGWILRYNVRTGAVSEVASATGCSKLHRPDGLTFGPDGRLYVTSFRADDKDIDRILIFNTATGKCADEIDLDQVNQTRAYAQYILFGPGGYLYVPITGDSENAGAVRRYHVKAKTFTNFVAPGGPLFSGWGLTFGRTNPATLAYRSS